jgi:NAD(P)-dependent dehydrogenase (short-subunit alcohol dehydrogenase family)
MTTGRLRDKVAVVTGSARGIGASIVALFAAEGAQVVGLDRQPVQTAVNGALNLTADVTRPEQVAEAIEITLTRFGRIDVLINNAGVNVFSTPLELTDSDWERCLDVDLKSSWIVAKAVLPQMLAGPGILSTSPPSTVIGLPPAAFPTLWQSMA